MSDLARALLHDLAAASEHLLDEGLAPRAASKAIGAGVRGPLGVTMRLADQFWRTVPRALLELEHQPSVERETVVAVREPRRATPSRRPYDYAEHRGTLAPVMWEARQPELELPTAPLAWLVFGAERLLERLEWHRDVLDRSQAEAVRFREGTVFGREELAQLEARRVALNKIHRRTSVLLLQMYRQSPVPLRPTPRLPYPFPGGGIWRRLRSILRAVTDPSVSLPALAADLQDPDAGGADLAFLYQRWCGLKLVEALERLGLRLLLDPIPPLLLAGPIEFRAAEGTVTLLCEPRLASRKDDLHGLFVTHGESSPDLVLAANGPAGRVVYVLDPTLSRAPDALRDKAKYLDVLSVRRSRTVAGVHLPATGPDRAWAAAPLRERSCRPADWRGAHGIVPMNPLSFAPEAVTEWARDLLRESGLGGRGGAG